jgi:hypothetical protein
MKNGCNFLYSLPSISIRKVKKLKKWLIVVLVTFGLVGCRFSSEPVVKSTDADPIVIQDTINGLNFYVELNKDTFSKGEEIRVKAKVTNERGTTLTHVIGSSSCPTPIKILITKPDEGYQLLEKGTENLVCTDDYGWGPFKPNETLEIDAVYVQKIRNSPSKKEAPRGTYEVKVLVTEILDVSSLEITPIAINTTISLVE